MLFLCGLLNTFPWKLYLILLIFITKNSKTSYIIYDCMRLANVARAFVIRARLGLLFSLGHTKVDLNDLFFSPNFATLTAIVGKSEWDMRGRLNGMRGGTRFVGMEGRVSTLSVSAWV